MNTNPFLKQVELLDGLPLSKGSPGQESSHASSPLPSWGWTGKIGTVISFPKAAHSAWVAGTGWECQFPLSELVG